MACALFWSSSSVTTASSNLLSSFAASVVASAAVPSFTLGSCFRSDALPLRLGHSLFQCGPSQYRQRACRSFQVKCLTLAWRGGSVFRSWLRSFFMPLSFAVVRKARAPLSSSTCLRNSRASWSPSKSRIARKVRAKSPKPDSIVSFTSSNVLMLSLTARTAFASLSATKLSARRLVDGSERFRRSNC
eukprot:6212857-Pleurochrysis_carterae.AAC.1